MPNYDYHCSSCGHEAEVFQKISEDPLRVCPSCGKESFERLVSRSSFALRGSGWYADGYGGKPAAGGEKPAATEKAPAESAAPKVEPKKTGD